MSADLIKGIHPYADKFPMLPDAELAELAESIAANGLRSPIVLTPDGLILDGRNRHEACRRVDVQPLTVIYEGDDLAEYVIDCNSARRHMTTGARAMSTAMVLEADGRRDHGRWKRGSVEVGNTESRNTWQDAMRQAGIILDFKPDLAPEVVSGALTLNAAFERAEAIRTSAERDKILERERKKRERDEAKAEAERSAQIVADLTEAQSSYLELIESGTMTPAAAWAAYREDTKKQRKREEDERRARSDLYSGIARGLQIIGGYGHYEDITKLMSEYNPAELNPPQYASEFSEENIRAAYHFLDGLVEVFGYGVVK